jgi:branched-chain amino acid transport system substrate-binding protein
MLFRRRDAVFLLALLLPACSAKQPTDPIQVAHILPLTGGDSAAAEDARRGVLLAVEEINAEDKRVTGRTVVVRTIDGQDDPELVQAEAVRLVTLNKVAAFVAGPDTRGADRLVRTAQTYTVPVVVPCDVPPGTAADGFLSLNVPPSARGEILARHAAEQLKPPQAVVLADQRNPVAVALAAAFVQEWRRVATVPVEEWQFHNDTERSELTSRLAERGAALVLFAGTPADLAETAAKLQREKAKATLVYGGEDVGADALRQTGAEVVTATVFTPDGLTDKGKEFAQRYQERFHEPPSFAAAQAYDAARLLFETMQKANTAAPARVRDEIMKAAPFESVTGTVTWKDRKTQRNVYVVRVRDGKATTVKTVAPPEN